MKSATPTKFTVASWCLSGLLPLVASYGFCQNPLFTEEPENIILVAPAVNATMSCAVVSGRTPSFTIVFPGSDVQYTPSDTAISLPIITGRGLVVEDDQPNKLQLVFKPDSALENNGTIVKCFANLPDASDTQVSEVATYQIVECNAEADCQVNAPTCPLVEQPNRIVAAKESTGLFAMSCSVAKGYTTDFELTIPGQDIPINAAKEGEFLQTMGIRFMPPSHQQPARLFFNASLGTVNNAICVVCTATQNDNTAVVFRSRQASYLITDDPNAALSPEWVTTSGGGSISTGIGLTVLWSAGLLLATLLGW